MDLTYDDATQTFSDDLLNISPPDSNDKRIEMMARVLAHGFLQEYWEFPLDVLYLQGKESWDIIPGPRSGYTNMLPHYVEVRWGQQFPPIKHLMVFGYVQRDADKRYWLTQKSVDLLKEPIGKSVFISYRRAASSAFALLLKDRLSAEGFDVFLDMQSLEPGEEWLNQLEQTVINADVFICLVGPGTLDSPHVRQEIVWALASNVRVIPVLHGGSTPEDGRDYSDIAALFTKQGVTVDVEHVLAYDNALRQLSQRLLAANQ